MKIKSTIKKITAMVITAALLFGVISAPADAAAKGYKFKYNGVTVTMNSKAAPLIKKAGKVLKKTVKKSCAYKGKDRTYKYKNFILYTYSKSDKGTEYINGITFLTKNVKTKEGIKIGSSLSDVKKKYGKGTCKFGIYTYKKGKSKLQIEVTGDKVTNIRYIAA